jgi:xanthine dehydrogenase YagS FAD-binding subunit
MKAFTYERANSLIDAAAASVKPGAKLIAGGTNLLDLMKLQVERPNHIVDINRLPLDKIEDTPEGGLRIGAMGETAIWRRTSACGSATASSVGPCWPGPARN